MPYTTNELAIINFFKEVNLFEIKDFTISFEDIIVKINYFNKTTRIEIFKGIHSVGSPFYRVYLGYSIELGFEYLYIPFELNFENKGVGNIYTPEEFKEWFIKSLEHVFNKNGDN